MIAEQERVICQVSREELKPFFECRFDRVEAVRCYAEVHGRFAHTAAVVQESVVIEDCSGHEQREFTAEEGQIFLVEVPPIVHRRTEEALATEQFEEIADRQQHRRVGVGREAPQCPAFSPFEVIDDVGGHTVAAASSQRNTAASAVPAASASTSTSTSNVTSSRIGYLDKTLSPPEV